MRKQQKPRLPMLRTATLVGLFAVNFALIGLMAYCANHAR
jgi:hypothetical protein